MNGHTGPKSEVKQKFYLLGAKEWIALTRKFDDRKWPQDNNFEFFHVEIFYGISLPETAHFFL